jgi:UPF0716 family protein affecting phage T7 exclusion
MTRPELDEFAALWHEPGAADPEDFEGMARRARRQGRLLAYADLAWAVLLIGGTIFAGMMAPGPLTTAMALVLVVATIWLTWKRRLIRQMSRTLDTSDRRAFLASSVRNARADLRRVTLSMLVFPLLVPMALLLKVAVRTGADLDDPFGILGNWVQSPRGVITLVLLALLLGWTERSRRRIKRELRRLEDLRQAYAEEASAEENPQGLP